MDKSLTVKKQDEIIERCAEDLCDSIEKNSENIVESNNVQDKNEKENDNFFDDLLKQREEFLKDLHKEGVDYDFSIELSPCIHIDGIIDEEIRGKNSQFTLHKDNKEYEILMCMDTIDFTSEKKLGIYVHVLAVVRDDILYAEIICDDNLYKLFDFVEGNKEKIYSMRTYFRLSPRQRERIEYQLKGKQYPLSSNDEHSYFRTEPELRLKYDMCRNTYTPQQQRAIEALFNKNGSETKRTERKLEYILNISNTYPGRKTLSRSEIMDILNNDIYGLDNVKEKIADSIIACFHTKKRGMRILFVGSPGTGKTHFSKTISKIFGIPYDVIYLNGTTNVVSIKGLSPTYAEADAGKPVKSFYAAQTTEEVLLYEHIDKITPNNHEGNPYEAMLDLLSDEGIFYDAFLEIPIDTSNTVHIATANRIEDIPDVVLSRFDIIKIDDYSDDERAVIAKNFIIPEFMDKYGIADNEIIFTDDAIREIIRYFCSDNGMHMLKEHIETLIRREISLLCDNENRETFIIDEKMVYKTLDKYVDSKDPYLILARNKDKFPANVRAEIKKMINHINSPNIDSFEKQLELRRLEYMTALVPDQHDFTSFDVDKFFKHVDETHFGLNETKDQVAKFMYSKSLQKKSFSSERILLVGDMGVGKTSLCISVAEALGIPFVKIALNGVDDVSLIKGRAKVDSGAIIKGLFRVRSATAVVQLDELDKFGIHNGVTMRSAMMDLLDDSAMFTDLFLGVEVDLSNVLFIATANDISSIEPYLLDRFRIIYIDGYTKPEKKHILTEYLLPKLEKEYAASDVNITINTEAADMIISDYCTSNGVRDIKRASSKIVADKLFAQQGNKSIHINTDDVMQSLGAKQLPKGNLPKHSTPGFAKALAVSGNEGEVFAIETVVIPNNNDACITGLPKESAVDSVKIAKTYIKLNYMEVYMDFGFHLHFGEGAVVKDGPSAGTAIVISMLSAIYKTPVLENISCTGEIDLFGNVFPVGGIKEKIYAAEKSGCTKVFIPYDNYEQMSSKDLEKFKIKIIPVNNVDEVISEVFPQIKKTAR